MKVLFASAEAAPVARVGGLAEASGGLARSLRRTAVELSIVLPDYGDVALPNESSFELSVPDWATPATVRVGEAPELGEVHLVSVPGMARPHPYVDETGEGWPDNDQRFFAFGAAIASLAHELGADVLHVNDWHTAAALAFSRLPSVYTIHTLGYQGAADPAWLDRLPADVAEAFRQYDAANPSAGAIRLADKIVAVSPNYAKEILDPARGAGLHELLADRTEDLYGIRNGIDAELWNPSTDPVLSTPYNAKTVARKADSTAALAKQLGWPTDPTQPIIGMVTRLVEQKGIDLALGMVPLLEGMNARMVILGSGAQRLTLWGHQLADEHPDRFAFVDGYKLDFAHLIFAGADLFLMPSRFEPCGLAQMQAMAYGTIPIVTAVGGLVDTVSDADRAEGGTGFVSETIDGMGMVDATHRAIRAWGVLKRRRAIQRAGMGVDWSWTAPAGEFVELYESIT
ncbi:MAG: glycogen synthase [Acidimicrobiales bacterium]|nr:glycogen synthase [Acidimicrobiales bacterium]